MAADLRRLNDALSTTELAGHYWVWGGMLIGWARENALLKHDTDADFGMMAEDLWRLDRAMPAIRAAGFRPWSRLTANDGAVAELAFRRRAAKFEFFVYNQVGSELRYHVFGTSEGQLRQFEALIPAQPLVSFRFLRRSWQRHADVDLELSSIYGDWRHPNPSWDYMTDDRAIRSSSPALHAQMDWDGSS